MNTTTDPALLDRLDALQRVADKALGVLNEHGIAVKIAHKLVSEIAMANQAIRKAKNPDPAQVDEALLDYLAEAVDYCGAQVEEARRVGNSLLEDDALASLAEAREQLASARQVFNSKG